jgi:hypothetical protein
MGLMDIPIKAGCGQNSVRSLQHTQFAVNKMIDSKVFNEAFEGRHVFLTGGTGMLGTALLVKMMRDTSVSAIHVLVRGGEGRYTPPNWSTHADSYSKLGFGIACTNYCHQPLSMTFAHAIRFERWQGISL